MSKWERERVSRMIENYLTLIERVGLDSKMGQVAMARAIELDESLRAG